jgi:hypothetical protein
MSSNMKNNYKTISPFGIAGIFTTLKIGFRPHMW